MDSMDTSQVPGEKLGATVAANIFCFFFFKNALFGSKTNYIGIRRDIHRGFNPIGVLPC